MEERDGRNGWKGRGCLAAMAVAGLAVGPTVAGGGENAPNVRLTHNTQRFAVARALGGALQRLDGPECQTLLDEFADASGRPLRVALETTGLSAPEYLRRVFFYDGPERLCGNSGLAVTTPGSRAVFICGSRFVREMSSNGRHAEAAIIHEMLHSLGLGENPPSSDYINMRVLVRCGQQRGVNAKAVATARP
jgi:hypothetical protein